VRHHKQQASKKTTAGFGWFCGLRYFFYHIFFFFLLPIGPLLHPEEEERGIN